MEYVYEGRLEIGGFGTNFLPDAETEHGDVPSVDRWVEEQIGTYGRPYEGPITVRVRLKVERLDV